MDIDRLLAEADPARSISIPGPDSPASRRALSLLTETPPSPAWRRPRSRARRMALAGVVSAAVATVGEWARGGGLRRSGRRRRIQLAAAVAAACAAVATGLLIVPLTTAAAPSGGMAPVMVSPPAVSPLPPVAPAPRTGLPPAALVGKAMLTAYNAASGDVVYERVISISRGTVVDESQIWDYPAQPVPGQQARERDVYAWRAQAPAKALTLAEDYGVAYKFLAVARSEIFRLTMVCYPGGRRFCGWGAAQTPAGTWSRVSFRSWAIVSSVAPGGTFNPAVIASQVSIGQWRVVGLTRLDGQRAVELSETSKGEDRLLPRPVLLWVNARTYLPIRVVWGPRTAGQEWDFAYLRPTPANLALLQVPIPRGYPRSNPFPG